MCAINMEAIWKQKGALESIVVNLDEGYASGSGLDILAGIENIFSGSGDDTLVGNSDDTVILGDLENDQKFGGAGDDWLTGGAGNDVIDGGAGADTLVNVENLIGSDFNDNLRGGGQNDTLYGDAGNDWLSGDNGADVLDGGAGDDILLGGADEAVDTFVFAAGYGDDRVRGFEDGHDVIDLSAYGFADKAAAMAHASQTNWGAVKFDLATAPGGQAGDVLYVEDMTLNTDFTDADIIV